MRLIILMVFLSIMSACGGGGGSSSSPSPETETEAETEAETEDPVFELSSTAFSRGGDIPLIHACTDQGGDNYSPQLSWQNAPEGTDSFALIMDDETPPCGTSDDACVHWNLFNIDSSVSSLVEDISPADIVDAGGVSDVIEGETYAGTNDYEGPCPPPGDSHVYFFTVYALSADHPEMTEDMSFTTSEFTAAYDSTILAFAGMYGSFPADS